MHYHLSQPDSGQTASASSVVGQGVELQNLAFPFGNQGEPLPGMFNINFQDKKIVVSLAIDQPTTGYGDYLMLFLPDTVKIYDVVINPATNWAGFTESDLYVDTDYPGGVVPERIAGP